MTNISQTAANVALAATTKAIVQVVQYGESVTQGMPVRLNTSDSKYYQADANVSAAEANASGIALTPGAANGFGAIATSGPVNLGATLVVGQTYVVSATKGAIAPIADLTNGDYPTILGVATTAAILDLRIYASGVVKP